MKQKPSSKRRRNSAKSILRLPDLEHAKAAVLNGLNSTDAKRGYRHAIDEFVDWYCSEPRLVFNRIVVLRYRSDGYASGRSAQGAPVRSTHRMPFNTDRRLFHGRPRPSFRRFGLGINGPRTFHWSSLRSRAV